jgi:hypothetical protein
VQLHLQSGSYVSVGEILTVPFNGIGRYKDVLLFKKSGSCGDPSDAVLGFTNSTLLPSSELTDHRGIASVVCLHVALSGLY